MQQPEPMPDLVHRRHALRVAEDVAAGQTARQDVAAVLDVVLLGRRGRHPGGRQRAVAEQDGARDAGDGRGRGQVRLQVDVQIGIGALAEGALHARVVGVRRPAVVDAEVHPAESEEDLVRVVGVGEVHELWGEGSISCQLKHSFSLALAFLCSQGA